MTRKNLLITGLLLALMAAGGALVATASAQKAAVPRQPDTVALAEDKVIELVLLLDTDQSGKISKQKFMNLMEAEFDRLDKDKTGELDPRDLRRWVAVSRGATGR